MTKTSGEVVWIGDGAPTEFCTMWWCRTCGTEHHIHHDRGDRVEFVCPTCGPREKI